MSAYLKLTIVSKAKCLIIQQFVFHKFLEHHRLQLK